MNAVGFGNGAAMAEAVQIRAGVEEVNRRQGVRDVGG